MTQLFVLGLVSLFGRIQADYLAHYLAPKQIRSEYLVTALIINTTTLTKDITAHNHHLHFRPS